MRRWHYLALLLFALLNGLDLLTTWVDFQLGAHEGNPLAATLLSIAGFGGLVIFKLALILLISSGVCILAWLKAYRMVQLVLLASLFFGCLWVGFNVLQALEHTAM